MSRAPRLRYDGITGYRLADHPALSIRRLPDRRWACAGATPAATGWLDRYGLRCKYRTRTEALQALQAHIALSAPPPDSLAPAAKLRRVAAGHHRTPDGRYEVRRRSLRTHWQVSAPAGHSHTPDPAVVRDLHEAALQIGFWQWLERNPGYDPDGDPAAQPVTVP